MQEGEKSLLINHWEACKKKGDGFILKKGFANPRLDRLFRNRAGQPYGTTMKCRIIITAATDLAAWVDRKSFMENVDLDDLACREASVVHDWYHPEWFEPDGDGVLRFTPPAFMFGGGRILGIDGRHRTVLLFRHMDAIPMLLANPKAWPKELLNKIIHREISEDEIIELPDLMTNKSLEKREKGIAEDACGPSSNLHFDIKIYF